MSDLFIHGRRLMGASFDVRNADATTLSSPELRPLTMVSADSHVSLPPKMYKEYLDSKYHDSWSGYLDDVAIINKVVELTGYPAPEDALEIYDKRGVVSRSDISIRRGGFATWRPRGSRPNSCIRSGRSVSCRLSMCRTRCGRLSCGRRGRMRTTGSWRISVRRLPAACWVCR